LLVSNYTDPTFAVPHESKSINASSMARVETSFILSEVEKISFLLAVHVLAKLKLDVPQIDG
jgi:hypothetical protein